MTKPKVIDSLEGLSDIEIQEIESEIAPIVEAANKTVSLVIDEIKLPSRVIEVESKVDGRVDFYKEESRYFYLLRRYDEECRNFDKREDIVALRKKLKLQHIKMGLDKNYEMPTYLGRTIPQVHPKGALSVEYRSLLEDLKDVEQSFLNELAPISNQVEALREKLADEAIREAEQKEWDAIS